MNTIYKLPWKKFFPAILLAFLLIYPLAGASPYMLHVFYTFFIWGVVAIFWNLLMGYAGINSLGNIGFLAIGGYVSGILAKNFGITPWLTILIGGLAACVLATIFLGFPALRLSGIYISLLTLIFADMLPSLLTQSRDITGGGMGLHEIPGFFPGMQKIHAYYICLIFYLLILFITYRIIHSSTGMAFVALRDSEKFAFCLGINKYRERIKVFAIASFLTGVAGGFYVHSMGDISPTTLGIEPFLLAIAMVELGGVGTFAGPIAGAFVIVFGNEFLRLAGTLRLTLLGALICTIILFFPGGMVHLWEKLTNWIVQKMQVKTPKGIQTR